MSDRSFSTDTVNQNDNNSNTTPKLLLTDSPKTHQSYLPGLLGVVGVLLIASLALNGYLLWLNATSAPRDVTTLEKQQSPTVTNDQEISASIPATPTSQPYVAPTDQLDVWLEYQQPGIAVQFKYLDTYTIQTDTITDGYGVEKKIIAFQNTGKFDPEGFDIEIKPGTVLSSYLLDVPVSGSVVGGQAAVYAELPNGYSDMGNTTRPMVIVETIYKGNSYTFRFVGLSDYKNEFIQQVIKTVMFK